MIEPLLLLLGLCVFLLVRNQYVYGATIRILRLKPISHALHMNSRLPSYDAMLFNPMYWTLWTASHWIAWIERKEARTA